MMACLRFTLNGKETDLIGKCYEYKGFKVVANFVTYEMLSY